MAVVIHLSEYANWSSNTETSYTVSSIREYIVRQGEYSHWNGWGVSLPQMVRA